MILREWCDQLLASNGPDALVTMHSRDDDQYKFRVMRQPELTREQLALRTWSGPSICLTVRRSRG